MTTAWRGIESRLGDLAAMPVVDEASAREALAELMSTVAQINATATAFTAHDVGEANVVVGNLAERLKDWIDRLIDKLTEIVAKIAKATSFTITVGTDVSVAVTFGPFGEGDVRPSGG